MQLDLHHAAYPRASAYDPRWLLSLNMGPNPLWLLEDLLRDVHLRSSMRVLDLGCGRGATSVFLAREFGVQVWAVDLWIGSALREKVFRDADVADMVHVVDADVRSLPFGDGFFDVIISIDAWEYFGTDDHLLPKLLRVLRVGGQVGVATPAMRRDPRELDAIPDHIRGVAGWEALTWHSAGWWEQQWRLGGLVTAIEARLQPDGWSEWLRWERAVLASGEAGGQPSIDMLEADGGELLTFAIVSATKLQPQVQPYDVSADSRLATRAPSLVNRPPTDPGGGPMASTDEILALLDEESDEIHDARFQIFMQELELHADPTFGEGRWPEVTRASQTLLDAMAQAFAVTREPRQKPSVARPDSQQP